MATCTHTSNTGAFSMRNMKTLVPAFVTTLLLAGCSDGTLETGAGAGDTDLDADPVAVALITPLVGVYDLPDNFEGSSSEAYLEIQSPDSSGSATALLFRANAFANCIESRPTEGDVIKDPFSDRIFLDNILAFDRSVLSLSGTSLVITLSNDVNDIDSDNDFNEETLLQAIRLGIMDASDLGETCT